MEKKLIILLLPVVLIFTSAGSTWVKKNLFNNHLDITILKEWKQESSNMFGIKTEQFVNRDKSIILCLCLENKDKKSFKKYLKYRYEAANVEVWKEARAKYRFLFNYEYDYKIYDYNYNTKNKGKYKKFVICINGVKKYLTITLIVKNEVLNKELDLLNRIFNSIEINS